MRASSEKKKAKEEERHRNNCVQSLHPNVRRQTISKYNKNAYFLLSSRSAFDFFFLFPFPFRIKYLQARS